jgi:hypothetical protein
MSQPTYSSQALDALRTELIAAIDRAAGWVTEFETVWAVHATHAGNDRIGAVIGNGRGWWWLVRRDANHGAEVLCGNMATAEPVPTATEAVRRVRAGMLTEAGTR